MLDKLTIADRSFDLVKLIQSRADLLPVSPGPPVEWVRSGSLVPYMEAVAAMEEHVTAIYRHGAPERVWLLEHPPLFTAGTSAKPGDLLSPGEFPVFTSGRGGQYTYHGPGQRILYLMLDLSRRQRDVRRFICAIEAWIIEALARLGVDAMRREGRTGIWVPRPELGSGREDKIAAIGIRIRHWCSFHGISINAYPDLRHYQGIVPCGIQDQGVTSLADLGNPATMADLDAVLAATFSGHFGPMRDVAAPPSQGFEQHASEPTVP